MAEVTVYGASDDLIEVEGAIREEFAYYEGTVYVAFSDGTVLDIRYTNADTWLIAFVHEGSATLTIDPPGHGDDRVPGYSARAVLQGDIAWVVYGHAFVPGGD